MIEYVVVVVVIEIPASYYYNCFVPIFIFTCYSLQRCHGSWETICQDLLESPSY